MGELIFIGMGLYSEKSITLEGIEVAMECDEVYVELYTSVMPGLRLDSLEKLLRRKIRVLTRKELEDGMYEIIDKARKRRIALMVPGDPFMATTHQIIRVEAEKRGVKTRIINGVSIFTAIPGLTGLHSYKFGRSVTLVHPVDGVKPYTVYEVVKSNLKMGLHSIILLDIKVEEGIFMTIPEAVRILQDMEEELQEGIFTPNRLVIGIARAGAPDFVVKADALSKLKHYDFGPPPHTLVVPSEKLHFTEAEALYVLAKAPQELLRGVKGWRR
ncbi:MAG: diphthine synthase [Thermoprotei archaeon]|nr:MAG: diphthine synthase [Thermoprotei archaeon]RLF24371.1 MAG: diphthine synthase [Thermoprotei archaeon]